MDSFDANKLLPPNIILNHENNLYKIGLNLTSSGIKKRSIFNNPLLIFSLNVVIVIKSIISLLLTEENENLLIITGDFAYILHMRIHANICIILFFLLCLISQLLYFYNFKNDIEPTYFKVFDMMSGLVSPKSIGLTDKQQIYGMVRTTKILFRICKWNNNKVIPVIAVAINLSPFVMKYSTLDTILFGIPNSLLLAFCAHNACNINIFQVVYFYLICRYIKIKFKESNDFVRQKKINNKNFLRFIRDLDAKYSELNEFDCNFWSKYLFSIWLIFVALVNFTLYVFLFTDLNIIYMLIAGYGSVLFILIFIFIISTASSVNYEANKIYKPLNHIMAHQSFKTLSLTNKLKVNINY
jgi:hypothetical protein